MMTINRIDRNRLPIWLADFLSDCDDEYLPTEECVNAVEAYWNKLREKGAIPPDDISPDHSGGLDFFWTPIKRGFDLHDLNFSAKGELTKKTRSIARKRH